MISNNKQVWFLVGLFLNGLTFGAPTLEPQNMHRVAERNGEIYGLPTEDRKRFIESPIPSPQLARLLPKLTVQIAGEDWTIKMSPDGKRLLRADSAQLIVYEVASGLEIARIAAQSKAVGFAFVSAGNEVLFTVENSSVLWGWTLATGVVDRRWDAPSELGKIFSGGPSEEVIVIGRFVGSEVWVFSWKDNSIRKIPIVSSGVNAATWSPDGKLIAVADWANRGGDDRKSGISLFNATTGEPLWSRLLGKEMISALAFSADSKVLAVGADDGSLYVGASATGYLSKKRKMSAPVKEIFPVSSNFMLVSQNGRGDLCELPRLNPCKPINNTEGIAAALNFPYIAVVNQKKNKTSVEFLDAVSLKVADRWNFADVASGLAAQPGGRIAMITRNLGEKCRHGFFDIAEGKFTSSFNCSTEKYGRTSISQDEKLAAVGMDNKIELINPETGSFEGLIKMPGRFVMDQNILFGNGSILILSIAKEARDETFDLVLNPPALFFDPPRDPEVTYSAWAQRANPRLDLVSISGKLIWSKPLDSWPHSIALSADETSVATYGFSRLIEIHDSLTGTHLETVTQREGPGASRNRPVAGVEFDPTGSKLLIRAKENNHVEVWNRQTQKVEFSLSPIPVLSWSKWTLSGNNIILSSDRQLLTYSLNSSAAKELKIPEISAISNDGKLGIAISSESNVTLKQIETNRTICLLSHPHAFIAGFSPSGAIVATMSRDIIKLWNSTDGSFIAQYELSAAIEKTAATLASGYYRFLDQPYFHSSLLLAWAAEESQLVIIDSWNQRIVRFATGTASVVELKPGPVKSDVRAVNKSGTLLALGGLDGGLLIFDLLTGKPVTSLGDSTVFYAVAFSGERSILGVSSDNSIAEWQLGSFYPNRRVFSNEIALDLMYSNLFYDPNSDRAVIVKRGLEFDLDREFGKQVERPDPNQQLDIVIVDLSQQSILHSDTLILERSHGPASYAFSSHHPVFVYCQQKKFCNQLDFSGSRLPSSVLTSLPSADAALLGGGAVLITRDSDGGISLLGAENQELIVRLIPFSDAHWLTFDKAGRFDTTSYAYRLPAHWIFPEFGLRPLSFDVFAKDYFVPGLAQRALRGPALEPVAAAKDINLAQPDINIESISPAGRGEVKVVVRVQGKAVCTGKRKNQSCDPGVSDVRLFRNSKLVARKDGNVSLDSQLQGRVIFDTVRLSPKKNDSLSTDFSAYAFNSDGVRSSVAAKTFRSKESRYHPQSAAHMLFVGIDKTESAEWDLDYSGNDAREMAKEIVERLRNSGQFSTVNSTVAISSDRVGSNEQLTKEDVKGWFRQLSWLPGQPESDHMYASAPSPNDLVLFYFAGHGLTDEQGKFYLILPQATKDDLDRTLQAGISSDEIAEWTRDIDVSNAVLILDTCESAGIVGKAFQPAPFAGKGFGQLAYDKGWTILAASQTKEAAFEYKSLKHGVLTYVLLREGLVDKKADFKPSDGKIMLQEFLDYALLGVSKFSPNPMSTPEDTEIAFARGSREVLNMMYGGVRQRPTLFRFTETDLNDFVIDGSRRIHQKHEGIPNGKKLEGLPKRSP